MNLKKNTILIEQIDGSGEISSVTEIDGRTFDISRAERYTILTDCDLDSVIQLTLDSSVDPLVEISDMKSFEGERHLYPIIAMDKNNRILMQAFANKEALEFTFLTGFGYYYSRSRSKLWKKGESSGHLQKVFEVRGYTSNDQCRGRHVLRL